jgi:hypothetical protein
MKARRSPKGRPEAEPRRASTARDGERGGRGTCRGLGLALLLFASGCRGTQESDIPDATPVVVARFPVESRIPERFQPSLEALRAAIQDGEEELAAQILEGIRARAPRDPEVLRLVAGFERILEGRELVDRLRLGLRLEELEGGAEAGDFRVLLDAEHDLGEPLMLSLPPARLERLVVSVDAQGLQAKAYESRSVDAFDALELDPGVARHVELCRYQLELGAALAVREQWALRPRSGSITLEGRDLPAMRVHVEVCEQTRLAPYLPAAPVAPEVLIEYTQRPEISMPALMERSVRVDPARRLETLRLLLPVVRRLAREDPGRLEAIAPALRWLARLSETPRSWAALLERRIAEAAGEPSAGSELELPARPRTPAGRPNLDLPREIR